MTVLPDEIAFLHRLGDRVRAERASADAAAANRRASLAVRPRGEWRLVHEEPDVGDLLYEEYWLATYDLVVSIHTEEDAYPWSLSFDEVLTARSALEFVRDWLEPERAALLDAADACWRAHPLGFNLVAVGEHRYGPDRETLRDRVRDGEGNWPRVPRSHWWWRPLPIGDGS